MQQLLVKQRFYEKANKVRGSVSSRGWYDLYNLLTNNLYLVEMLESCKNARYEINRIK